MSEVTTTRCDKCARDIGTSDLSVEIWGADFCPSCTASITLREAFDIAHSLQHRQAATPFLDPKEPF